MTPLLEQQALDFRLASRLFAYPDEHSAAEVADLRALGAGAAEPAVRPLVDALERASDGSLEATYLALFENGPGRTSLHETEYGRMRGMSKGNDLADVAGFYRAFGLSPTDGEMPDHVAMELEFYSVLLVKQAHLHEIGDAEGVSIVEDARRKFLTDHLGPLALALGARPALSGETLYGPAAAFCGKLVSVECEALGVTAAPLDPFADPDASSELTCGGSAEGPLVGIRPRRQQT